MSAPAAAPPQPQGRRAWSRTALALTLGVLALVLLTTLAGLGGGWWLLRSPSGLDWAVRQVPGLSLQGRQGQLAGGPFSVERLQWRGNGRHIVIDGLAWDDAQWAWRPHAGAWLGLRLERARASRVQVTSDAAPQAVHPPAPPPRTLRLPVELQAPGLRIGSVMVDGQAPLTDIGADLHLGAAGGAEHRLQAVQLRRAGLQFQGQAVLDSGDGLPLHAAVQLLGWPGGQASLSAQGPLQRLAIEARLQQQAGAGLTAQATLAPFAAWPLLALAARATELDLSAWAAGLPQTRLNGQATLRAPRQTPSGTDPLVLEVQLDNSQPGPWDAGRLPLRQLQVLLQGQPADPGTLVFEAFTAQLAGLRDAGVVTGSGSLRAGQLDLQLRLDGVRPERLHTAAPPMTLGGTVRASASGWPGTAGTTAGRALQAAARLDLTGALPRAGTPPLALQAAATLAMQPDGSLQAGLADLRAQAGTGGSATGQAMATRNPAGDWQLQSSGALAGFDPGPWWPAARQSRQGQALNGRWQADLTLLAAAPGPLAALRGQAGFTLADSRFAGLDWRGAARLQATATALQATADLHAGPNRLQLDGSLATTPPAGGQARGAVPQGTLDIQAPDLAALAPVAALLPASAAAWWPTAGTLSAQASAQGRWPAVQTTGSLQASNLRSLRWRVGRADAGWTLASAGAADAPLAMTLQATDLASGAQRIDTLDARLQGSLRQHSLQLRASSPLRPPAWAEAVAGTPGPAGSTLVLQAQGSWAAAAAGGGTWRGQVVQVDAAPRTAPAAGAAGRWLFAQNLQGSVVLGADGALRQASLEPGRIELFGGAVAWQQARWQAAAVPGGAPRIAVRAQLEPLRVAPWLARLQPQFGWRGDLAVAGRLAIDSGERFDADLAIERTAGDLSLSIDGATRALDLSDLRLGVSAHGGLWQLTQALVGRSVGVVGGLQTVHTTPQALWPGGDAALEGGLSLIVPQLQVWAPWLPPGWRLGGQLRVAASFAGTAGAPQYRGSITGEGLAVRNLFEGIRLEQGALAVALQGREAVIERFAFRDGQAGDAAGLLSVSGQGSFDVGVQARLRVEAQKMRLLDRFDRRITASGTADVRLDTQALRVGVRGAFGVDEGLVDATQADAPRLGSDVVVRNRASLLAVPGTTPAPRPLVPSGPALAATDTNPAPAAPNGTLANADVDVRVDLGPALRLRGRGLDTLLRGQLRVTTPGGPLAVNGVVRAEEGTYRAYGQNLRIERGNLVFRGEVATPQLDILALRADIDQRVGVVVSGTPVNPRVRLYSEPELGQLDTLTWLVLGRAPEGLGRDDTALLQRAALALLAGERGGDNGFLQKIGLDELSLSRASSGGVNDTIISLGKQISRRVYVGYEHALGGAGGTLQLIYRIANRITLRARTGSENAVDAIWTWRWN